MRPKSKPHFLISKQLKSRIWGYILILKLKNDPIANHFVLTLGLPVKLSIQALIFALTLEFLPFRVHQGVELILSFADLSIMYIELESIVCFV